MNIKSNLFTVAIWFLVSDLIIFYNAVSFSSKMIEEKLRNIFKKIFYFKILKMLYQKY